MIDAEQRAKAIHVAISKLLETEGTLRIGFDSRTYVPKIIEKLKKGYFKLPIFGKKEWIRNTVVKNSEMFVLLAGNIELQMVYNGSLYRWNGYGSEINPKNVPEQIQNFIRSKQGPFYVVIQLGVDCDGFGGLLDGISN